MVGNQSRWLAEIVKMIGSSLRQVVFLSFYVGNVQFFVDSYEIQLKYQAIFMDESPFSGISALVEDVKEVDFIFNG